MTVTTSESLAGSGIDEAACAAEIAAIDARATRIETPCGEGTMVWRQWGEGRPVILGHGSQGNWTHWIRNIDELSRHFRIIAPDTPGHGDSALPTARGLEDLGRIMGEGLRQVLRPGETADLIGFSFGGVCFAWLAADVPELVRSLAMIGSGGLGTPTGEIELTRVRGLSGKARANAHRTNLLGLMLHDPDSVDDMAIYLSETGAAKCRFAMQDYMIMPDWAIPALARVKAPFHAIWGRYDRPHPDPEDQLRMLRKVLPHTRMHVIEDAGHWAIYEKPEAFNAVLLGIAADPAPAEA